MKNTQPFVIINESKSWILYYRVVLEPQPIGIVPDRCFVDDVRIEYERRGSSSFMPQLLAKRAMTHTPTSPKSTTMSLRLSLHTLYRVESVGGEINARTQLSLSGSQLLGGEAVQGQIWNEHNSKVETVSL